MYKPARGWASDLLPLSLANGEVPGMKNEAARLPCGLLSSFPPVARGPDFFLCCGRSGSHYPQRHHGRCASLERPTAKSEPFQITQFVIDSDVAYETASHKAAAWLKEPSREEFEFLPGKMHPGFQHRCVCALGNTNRATQLRECDDRSYHWQIESIAERGLSGKLADPLLLGHALVQTTERYLRAGAAFLNELPDALETPQTWAG